MSENVIRIVCPGANMPRGERVARVYDNLKAWVFSAALQGLLKEFGIIIDNNLDFNDYLQQLKDASNQNWDFRRGKERSEAVTKDEVIYKEALILESSRVLGLTDITTPAYEPDLILPLGGFRIANLTRCLTARRLIEENNWKNKQVIALSGKRPINKAIETPYIESYAKEAATEYDVINRALEEAFDLVGKDGSIDYREKQINVRSTNINLKGAIRTYNSYVLSLAAPSTNSERRANTMDSFEFLIETLHFAPLTRFLMTTSCIYQPYQQMTLIRSAIEHNIEVDTIGVDVDAIARFEVYRNALPAVVETASNSDEQRIRELCNYLQEVNGTINAMYTFVQEYPL